MPKTIWGTGALYGAGTSIYGRISTDLASAQLARVRETGLIVQVLEEQNNNWSIFTQVGIIDGPAFYRPVNAGRTPIDPLYYSYRGDSATYKYADNDIRRYRVGSPSDVNDRQLWEQLITAPGTVAQWESWSLKYSATTLSVEAGPNDLGAPTIYSTRLDGVYMDNTKVWTPAVVDGNFAAGLALVPGSPGAAFVFMVREDDFDKYPNGRGKRDVNIYYSPNLRTTAPAYVGFNFRWARPALAAFNAGRANGYLDIFMSTPLHHDPRDGDHGNTLWRFQLDPTNVVKGFTEPESLRGIGGGAGKNYLSNPRIYQLSDGYYYMFYLEVHLAPGNTLDGPTNLGYGVNVWQRSKDLIHWSEPVVGPGYPGTGMVVESGGFVYFAGNGAVYRRPIGTITRDVSNYVPQISFELPRDNQPASGKLSLANPAGVNDALLNLSDAEVVVKPGMNVGQGGYEFEQFSPFYIAQTDRDINGQANRLTVTLGDIWARLNNPIRDVINFVGQTEWLDWYIGRRNQPFNYYFATGSKATVTVDHRLAAKGIVLYTGWKGFHSDHQALFTGATSNPRLIARYIDSKNYIFLEMNGTSLDLREKVNGVDRYIDSASVPADSTPRLRLSLAFHNYQAYLNDVLVLDNFADGWANVKPGYVGFQASSYRIRDFRLKDWEKNLTMEDLIRMALAYGDLHDVIISDAASKAYAIIWGPQTDIPTAADGLTQILTTEKLQMVWRDGRVEIGKFTDETVIKSITDVVLESSEVNEPKRRINLAIIDGNTDSWLEIDVDDTHARGRQTVGYFDLPELTTPDAVIARARQEIKQGKQGAAPGAKMPLYFDLRRMDVVQLTDNFGTTKTARIEGISVDINQSTKPKQLMTLDTSLLSQSSKDILISTETNDPEAPTADHDV